MARKPTQLMAAAVVLALLSTSAAFARTATNEPEISGQPGAQSRDGRYGIPYRRSVALGLPYRGSLVRGVRLPGSGIDHFTWDLVLDRLPNRAKRRWGTYWTVVRTLNVLHDFRVASPGAPRVGVADLSRPEGGPFGPRFGGQGHASHQNGLDVDVLYPRHDAEEQVARKPSQLDPDLSQRLVDAFVAAGARYVFVGPHTDLTGPPKVVLVLAHHDDHMHVRWRY